MPDNNKARGRGVRTLDDVRDRCRIDDETGCWVWAMACSGRSPRAHVRAGVIGDKAGVTTVARLSWVLSGRELAPKHHVYRLACCGEPLCVNPDHLGAGTRAAMSSAVLARGGYHTAKLQLVRRAGNLAQALPLETVQAVQRSIEGGASVAAASREHGVHERTASAIAKGRHIHQRPEVRGASVFSWGGVA